MLFLRATFHIFNLVLAQATWDFALVSDSIKLNYVIEINCKSNESERAKNDVFEVKARRRRRKIWGILGSKIRDLKYYYFNIKIILFS